MIFRLLAIHPSLTDEEKKTIIRKTVSEQVHRAAPDLMLSRLVLFLFVCLLFLVVVAVEFGLFFCTYIDFKTIIFLFLFPFSAGNGNTGNHVTAAARTGGRYSPFHYYYYLLSSLVLLFIMVIILYRRNSF